MKEKQFIVLKTMVEATSKMDVNTLAKKVDLSPNQTILQIQDLAKEGYLQRVGGGYGITDKGKAALKANMQINAAKGFHFYNGIDQPTDSTALSIEQFYKILKQISIDSIEFHLNREDFENWLRNVCEDSKLANEFGSIKAAGSKGEVLRAELLKALDLKYSIRE